MQTHRIYQYTAVSTHFSTWYQVYCKSSDEGGLDDDDDGEDDTVGAPPPARAARVAHGGNPVHVGCPPQRGCYLHA